MSKTFMAKRFSIMLVIALALSVLAACGSEGNNGGNAANETNGAAGNAAANAENAAADPDTAASDAGGGEITGEITFATHRVNLVDTDLKRYVEAFEAKYPGTKVKIEGIKDYDKTMRVRLAAGELPDVLSLLQTTPADYPKYYEPLDSLGWNDRLYFTDFTSYEGKLYGISQQAAVNGLVYSKKAFAEAGIAGPPKTLDELYAISEQLKGKGIIPMGTAFKDAWTLQYWHNPVEFYYGSSSIRVDNLKTDTPFTVGGPYGKGLGILKTLHDKGYLEKDIYSANYDQTVKDIASGKIAMMYIGNWLISYLLENGMTLDDIGFAPLPFDNSGKFYGNMQPDWAYAVSKTSGNKATAMAFIKFMVEESGDFKDHYIMSPLKDVEQTLPQLVEFMSYNPTMMEMQPPNEELLAVENKMQFNLPQFIQEVTVKDMQTVFDQYNKKWAEAKQEVNK